jgi:hypothetical protein
MMRLARPATSGSRCATLSDTHAFRMADTSISAGYWAFQVPNLLLAALMYTLIGRFILALVYDEDSDRTIWRVFQQITQPALNLVQFVTPKVVPPRIVVLFAVIWVLLIRLVLLVVFLAFGLLPPMNIGGVVG